MGSRSGAFYGAETRRAGYKNMAKRRQCFHFESLFASLAVPRRESSPVMSYSTLLFYCGRDCPRRTQYRCRQQRRKSKGRHRFLVKRKPDIYSKWRPERQKKREKVPPGTSKEEKALQLCPWRDIRPDFFSFFSSRRPSDFPSSSLFWVRNP